MNFLTDLTDSEFEIIIDRNWFLLLGIRLAATISTSIWGFSVAMRSMMSLRWWSLLWVVVLGRMVADLSLGLGVAFLYLLLFRFDNIRWSIYGFVLAVGASTCFICFNGMFGWWSFMLMATWSRRFAELSRGIDNVLLYLLLFFHFIEVVVDYFH